MGERLKLEVLGCFDADHQREGRHAPELGTQVHLRLSQSGLALWPCLPCPPPEPESDLEPWDCHPVVPGKYT